MEPERVRPLVERYLRERRAGAVEAQLASVTAQLDAAYWDGVEDLTTSAARDNPDRLILDKEARLRIDLGLVDWDLLEGGEKNRAVLLREIYAPSPPGQFYFSEWLAHRYRSFVLMARVSPPGEEPREEPAAAREARVRLYRILGSFFKALPGFPTQAVDLFLSCRLDDAIEGLTRRLARQEDERIAEQRKQLATIRSQMIARARERARAEAELALFDALAKLDRMTADAPAASVPERETVAVDEEMRVGFLRGEVKLVRSLLRLGATGSGLARTHSVLVGIEARLTKSELAPLLAHVRGADAGLPALPSIVIAPYVGTGFYEWDRDTVFVPLRSTRSPEESVVTALANFRLLLDSLQQEGALKRAYQEALRPDEFRDAFIRDYRGWVTGVARGYRGALTPERYAFFQEHVGPRAEHLFAPHEWTALTPEERARTIQECRARVNAAEAGFEDRYRLAVAYHHENRLREALEQVHEAVRLNPVDGRGLLARARLCIANGAEELARSGYREILDLCPNTIWSVYAGDELARLG